MIYPPFCPNKDCDNYHFPQNSWYVKYGTYRSNRSGRVQRFKCLSCGRVFSTETFSIDYHAHINISYRTILEHIVTSSGIRDLSRILKVSCSTVTNRISRLARQAMAVSAVLTKDLRLGENLVADGFESFVKSQYLPNNINILVGKDSQIWLMSDYSQLTRKGKMTEYQKAKNNKIKKKINFNRVTIYESFKNVAEEALRFAYSSSKESISFITDEHPHYRKVLCQFSAVERKLMEHIRISSKKERTVSNPLFSVNYIDREIRKDNSDHTRETVQFARNTGNAMERLAIYRMYHNFMKPYRINGNGFTGETHGSAAGLSNRTIKKELKTLFTQRRFLGKTGSMNIADRILWCKCLFTPLNTNADILPGYVTA